MEVRPPQNPEAFDEEALKAMIDDLLSLKDDGDNRFNAVFHMYKIVLDGSISDDMARRVLRTKGFADHEIDEVFEGDQWVEVEDSE